MMLCVVDAENHLIRPPTRMKSHQSLNYILQTCGILVKSRSTPSPLYMGPRFRALVGSNLLGPEG